MIIVAVALVEIYWCWWIKISQKHLKNHAVLTKINIFKTLILKVTVDAWGLLNQLFLSIAKEWLLFPHLTYPLRARWHIRPRCSCSIYFCLWPLFLLYPIHSILSFSSRSLQFSSMLFSVSPLVVSLPVSTLKLLHIYGYYLYAVNVHICFLLFRV